MNGRVGCNTAYDRWIEYLNHLLKERNSGHQAFEHATTFTEYLKAIAHVDMQFSEAWGEGLDTPIGARGNYVNDISSLVSMFHDLIPDPALATLHQPFQGAAGGNDCI